MAGSSKRWIGIGALGLIVGLTLWRAPEIATGTFSDLGTFLRVLALVVALVGWVLLVYYSLRAHKVRPLIAWLPVALVLALLLWPYIRPARTVDEAFPTVTSSVTSTPDSSSGSAPVSALPDSTSTPLTSTPTTPVPRTLYMLRGSGKFQGLTGHRGDGTASLYDMADGSRLLRFEEVDIGSGPKLVVYLVPGADQRSLTDAIEIAPLTAERGNQNYEVDPSIDLYGDWTVLVWCETFDLEVANATLSL
ncbi:MAG: DM13 domain-containing protein [Actinomycetota bacterium]|nr:DM13 domain-containing protein [Actinomycetota bacterium]